MNLVKDTDWAETTKIYQQSPFTALARVLHYSAMEGMDAHKDELEEIFKRNNTEASHQMVGLYTEYLVLFIHLVVRHSDALFGRQAANRILKELMPYIARNAQAYYEGDEREVLQTTSHYFNEAETDYASAKYWASSTEADSLRAHQDPHAIVVKLQRRLAKVLHKNYNDVIDQVYLTSKSFNGTIIFFSFINLDEWLKGPAIVLGIENFESIDLSPPPQKTING